MSFLHTLAGLLRRREPAEDPAAQAAAEALKARFRERCAGFRRLLSANKAALEALAEVEERLAGTRPFGMDWVRGVCTRAVANVYQMILQVNNLSGNRYPGLLESFSRISAGMEAIIAHHAAVRTGPLVLPLTAVSLADIMEVGGKMANLGEMSRHVGLPVPDGFAVTAAACEHFIRENALQEEIDRRIQATEGQGLDALFTLSASLQQLILTAPVPQDLAGEILEQVARMEERARGKGALRLALRSSAVGEDALGASFAGQYHSELNVHPDDVLDVWREILASKYSVTAMSYRFERGIPDDAVPMCVGVLAMVPAMAGGVAYSRSPVPALTGRDLPAVVINAVHGLPQAVVDGSFSPDTFVLSRERPPRLLERRTAVKPFRFVCDAAEGVRRVSLTPEEAARPSISDATAEQLASLALALEEYYGEPQDVEWAVAPDGDVILLQSRPVKEAEEAVARPEAGGDLPDPLLTGGTSVSPGLGSGQPFVARKEADILAFPQGGVLVVERAQPRWATLLSRAAALVTEAGGAAGHLASVAREYGVPAIFGLEGAMAALDGLPGITVDADGVRIFAGRPDNLPAPAPRRNLMAGSPIHETLRQVSRLMVPLNLLDPSAATFAPEHCATLHDITRFCHEKSVDLIFGQEDAFEPHHGKQLRAGVTLQYWVIDLDDAFATPVRGPVVDLSNIRSAPFLALWKGMTAVPWNGPPATDAAGFLSVVLESTMNRDLEAATASSLSNRNFLMLSSTFMNLQARFGYHFSTVESQAGDSAHENYVSFQFKGGAADQQRRAMRARMVASLLEDYGFRAEVKEDALFAAAEGYSAGETLRRVTLLGYLLIHTRQVDMIMRHEDRAEALRRRMADDMARLAREYQEK